MRKLIEQPDVRPLTILLICALLTPFVIQSGASGQIRRPSRLPAAKEGGLKFRLSEGKDESKSVVEPRISAPPAEPISDEAAENLLKRLPPIKIDPEDEKEFAMRDRSLPAPRTGQTISESFPPGSYNQAPDPAASGPLEVLRFAPEGEIPLAPHLSITFSQPMVAVTSNDDLAAGQVPVKLTPLPPGKWRWIGTKTLLFEPTKRFPMATRYTVEIPAGTKSATGGALASTKQWTFSTPPVRMKSRFPEMGPHSRNPIFFIEFDQRVDQSAILKSIRVTGSNLKPSLRPASPEEIEADPIARQMKSTAIDGNWVAFRATGADAANPLPAGTMFVVSLDQGAPSAEGPRKTEGPQTFSFNTYFPLQLTSSACGYQDRCEPGMPWNLQFNNPLDQNAFDPGQIRITPEIPNVKVINYGQTIQIQGASSGRTTYTVRVAATLKDIYGQTLGAEKVATFNVGDAAPNLAASAEGYAVLDPFSAPRFSIYSTNHRQLKVSVYAVGPEHWATFAAFMSQSMRYGRQKAVMPPIGRVVSSKVVQITGKPDDLTETGIDLKAALGGDDLGHAIVSVEAVQPPKTDYERRSLQVWVQATHIGLDAFADQTTLMGWATNLRDGKPLGDVELSVVPEKGSATAARGGLKTGADGVAKFALPATGAKKLLIARKGNDVAIMPEFPYFGDNGDYSQWQKRDTRDQLRWHVFDDRGLYKPGEEVHVKGWVRDLGFGPTGDVGAANDVRTVSYRLNDSRGNEVLKGSAQVNALGGFDAKFKLPPTMNLGAGGLNFQAQGATRYMEGSQQFYHRLNVQEFRRPEYEVKATVSDGPHFIREHAVMTIAASYYAGGGLPNAEVNWNVTTAPTNFTPPNRGDFIFGKWVPWWTFGQVNDPGGNQQYQARTDASGKHFLRIDFDSVDPARPTSVTAFANVQDVNRQSVAGRVSYLVHPSQYYVGLRTKRMFVQKGEALVIESIVTDLDGKAVANREIRMTAALIDYVYEKGEYKEREIEPQSCVIKSTGEPVKCTFQTKEGGRYRIKATVIDDRERRNETEMTLWVAGGKQPPQRDLAQEKVELIPSQKEFKAGETAELLIQAPFAPAEGILTLRREGLVTTERFSLASTSHTLKIPIQDAYTPNVYAQVDLVGSSTRTDEEGKPQTGLPKRPAFASGSINLTVPPTRRTLAVTATPREKAIEPGMETMVDVDLRDADGKSISGGEVAVVVVDEAVLALSNYQLPNPLASFYSERGPNVSDFHLRDRVQLGKPGELIGQASGAGRLSGSIADSAGVQPMTRSARAKGAPMATAAPAPPGAMMEMRAESPKEYDKAEAGQAVDENIATRIDFNALATFAAATPTDANGRASVKVKLPDNLTRYRVMAVAVAGDKQFGSGESAITARLPLMVRPSAPRFLNFGDKIELPVVLQNQTDAAMTAEVAVRAGNALLTSGKGRRVTIPANDRVEVRFPVTTVKPGTARFQFAGASGKSADAAEISLPVWTPATTEAFATYGEVDAGAVLQPVKAPSDAFKQFGGLEISTSSTQLQALTDAVIYLTNYPYECAEQISSRVLAIAALKDVLGAFDAKGLPPADQLIAFVDRDLKRLAEMQNPDGSFGFWRRGELPWPYLGIHAAHAFQRAKEKGFTASPEVMGRSTQYLKNIERFIPSTYPVEVRRTLIAYSIYVRNRMGDRDTAKARTLIANAGGVDHLSLESLGWILPVLGGTTESAAIRRYLANRVEETAAAAHFTTSYSDGAYLLLHSSRRADGVLLESIIGDEPKSDLIPKIVRGLLAHRKAGRWENTQENCFILLALDRYFATYEKVTPDFVARAWLGDAYAGEHAFRGRTTERHAINIPMSYLMSQPGAQNLALAKEGAGRMYYRIGMNYAPTSLTLKPAEYGFTVTRTFEAIDDPSDVRRNEDGSWRIKAGAQVRVRLSMVAPTRRYHVALVDPLAAGLEAMNPELATTGFVPPDQNDQNAMAPGSWWRRWWRWYEHQNMRDERVEAFSSLVWEGVHNYSYVARATTPGVFVVPPAKAEEMYHPETFGRSGSDRVVIE